MKILCSLFVVLCLGIKTVSAAATSDQYLAAGNTLYDQKNYDRAILYYKAAIQVDPNNAAAHTRLANTYYMLGQKQDALTQYQAALQLNPNNTQLAAFVQKLKAQLGNTSPSASMAASSALGTVKTMEINVGVAGASGGLYSTFGIGGTGSVYFRVDHDLWLGGALSAYDFSTSTTTTTGIPGYYTETVTDAESLLAIEVLASMKYYFDGEGLQPYLLGGAGLSLLSWSSNSTDAYMFNAPYSSENTTTTTPSSASGTYPMLQAGAGLKFEMSTGLYLFLEAKYSLIISSGGSASYIPFDAGLTF